MSDDIVQRLRAWSPLISSGLEVPAAALVIDKAAAEIERLRALVEASGILSQPGALTVHCVRGTVSCQEAMRLRARVAVLETALRHYEEDEYNGACARAALKEAQP